MIQWSLVRDSPEALHCVLQQDTYEPLLSTVVHVVQPRKTGSHHNMTQIFDWDVKHQQSTWRNDINKGF